MGHEHPCTHSQQLLCIFLHWMPVCSFICDRWDRNHWSTSDPSPMLISFHPMPEKRKRGVRRDEWQSQLLLRHPRPPLWSAWPNSLSRHWKSQAQSLPQIPEWKAGWPNFSSFWKVDGSCFSFSMPYKLLLYLSKQQKAQTWLWIQMMLWNCWSPRQDKREKVSV